MKIIKPIAGAAVVITFLILGVVVLKDDPSFGKHFVYAWRFLFGCAVFIVSALAVAGVLAFSVGALVDWWKGRK